MAGDGTVTGIRIGNRCNSPPCGSMCRFDQHPRLDSALRSFGPRRCLAAWPRRGLLFATALLAVAPARAVERVLEIAVPAAAAPGVKMEVSIRASTDAGAGEQIGFLHAEYSIDSGRTWTGLCYEQKLGCTAMRRFSITTGAAGSKTLVRARVAFREGVAGDVDYDGAAVKWQDSWRLWRNPPARWAETLVTAQ